MSSSHQKKIFKTRITIYRWVALDRDKRAFFTLDLGFTMLKDLSMKTARVDYLMTLIKLSLEGMGREPGEVVRFKENAQFEEDEQI